MAEPLFKIENHFSPALVNAFAASRTNRDLAEAVNYIMRLWVDFAKTKIIQADRNRIQGRLELRAERARFDQGREKRLSLRKDGSIGKADQRYLQLRHSVAAYVVYLTNWKWKGQPVRGLSAAQFYKAVDAFIKARRRSAGYLKSGLRPAQIAFRSRRDMEDAQGPKLKRFGPPGSAQAASPSDPTPMAAVEDHAKAILLVAPNAFLDALPEVTAKIEEYVIANLMDRAKAEGLKVTRKGA